MQVAVGVELAVGGAAVGDRVAVAAGSVGTISGFGVGVAGGGGASPITISAASSQYVSLCLTGYLGADFINTVTVSLWATASTTSWPHAS